MSEDLKQQAEPATAAAKAESAKRSRRSFLVMGIGALGAYEFYHHLDTSPGNQMMQRPLRRVLEFNQEVSELLFHDRALAPTYPVSQAVDLRINGNFGLKQDLKMASYRLQVVGVDKAKTFRQYVPDVTTWTYEYVKEAAKYEGHDTKEAPKPQATTSEAKIAEGLIAKPAPGAAAPADDPNDVVPKEFSAGFAAAMAANSDGRPPRGLEEAGESDSTLEPGTPGLLLTLDDLKALPRHELVTQFKCIEGWSEIVHWGGYRMADFIAAYPPARNAKGELPKYVYLETPNGDYYCGYELHECMHPQSLLATEMAGKPLTQAHGSPLRLHMPIKYGYKQLKRIGLIAYTDDKPDDYWTKLGYDWYAGL